MSDAHVGAVFAAARRAAGLTQKQVALRVGVSHTQMSRIENGVIEPTANVVAALRAALAPASHLALVEAKGAPQATVCGLAIDGFLPIVEGAVWLATASRCPDCVDVVDGVLDSLDLDLPRGRTAQNVVPPLPRCGDTVRHISGQEWIVAYATPTKVCAMGSPDAEVDLEDCELVERVSDEVHWTYIAEWRRMPHDRRSAVVLALYGEVGRG